VQSRNSVAREQPFFRGERDPYFPKTAGNTTPLPTNDDWVFRVKVISSTTNLQDDVFEKAVQGLVKICFPQGVLEELGIDVLERHMREEGAPEDNIKKMTEIFLAEMVHRTTWMLAEYLDTPEKVQTGVTAVIAASESLHGDIGPDIRSTIAASLAKPVEILDEMLVEESDEASRDRPAPVSTQKQTTGKAKTNADDQDAHNGPDDGSRMDVDNTTSVDGALQSQSSEQHGDKDKKVSTSWRWNIEPENISPEAVAEAFKRPSDLFAFHALPIARTLLHPEAKRKVVRTQIQTMLNEMSDNEWQKWIDSLQKLHDGNDTMLIRVEPDAVSELRRTAASTPAPIDARRRAAVATSKGHRSAARDHVQGQVIRGPIQRGSHVKSEPDIHSGVAEEQRQRPVDQSENSIASATSAVRHLSTEEPDARPTLRDKQLSGGHRRDDESRATMVRVIPSSDFCTDSVQGNRNSSHTPIIDLLWGEKPFGLQARSQVVQTIMDRFNHRVAAEVSTALA